MSLIKSPVLACEARLKSQWSPSFPVAIRSPMITERSVIFVPTSAWLSMRSSRSWSAGSQRSYLRENGSCRTTLDSTPSSLRFRRGGQRWRFGDCLRKCAAGASGQAPLGLNSGCITACIVRRIERSGSAIGTPFGAWFSHPTHPHGRSRRQTPPLAGAATAGTAALQAGTRGRWGRETAPGRSRGARVHPGRVRLPPCPESRLRR